jgi:hypothetical protein
MESEVEVKYPRTADLIRKSMASTYIYKIYGIDTSIEVMNNTPRCVLDAIEAHLQGE